ncbi:hypothetical protein K437DRAFT_258420 [Tilletiaria anomala UBC 951]|uniref:Calcipressin-domain-containing protein n=1 Tax=Tilletiaria anomala (strain ATCC 24038 / CBS 436.72 / UBC 951) TaxID=1037660 RepID=A0A066VL86_TILAU|nr:uncharacterized protein K437DRAFT_258420 [Tilletiaria anomala UBC 951]KDN41063.1 hypothetical protein K437DRAFT_258420 [Tilletiaria anomala UBC 951]
MWIVVPSNGGEGAPTLDELFDALSICSSLHSSSGGANSDGHPLASIGPFGTGLRTDAPPGAFEDAEDVDEAEIAVNGAQPEEAGLSETGRRALAHLEAVLDWPGEEDATTTSNPTDIESGAAGRGKEAHAQASAVSDLQTATQEPSRVTPSNTLIFASLPPEFFDTPELARALLDLLHAYGKLLSYLPLPLFGRAVVAYEELEAAKRAKEKLDLLLLPFEDESEETVLADEARYSKSADYASGASGKHSYDTLRVYYGPSSSEIFSGRESASKALGVPITDRNFLISPPGSPPVGWEPIVEDPPNQDTLADDLIRALGQLRDSGANLEDHRPKPLSGDGGEDDQKGRTTPTEDSEEQQAALAAPRLASAQPAVIIPAMGAMPGVSVEAFDGAEDGDRQTAITSGGKKYMGVSISSVKATVESMRSNRSRSGSNASLLSVEDAQTGLGGGGASSFGKITPTARPPLAP